MQIFIGNLSAEISALDLAKFFKGYGNLLTFKFRYYLRGGKPFYYALTEIEPRKLAEGAITRRHMKRLKGRVIVVHPYLDRGIINERRSLNWREKIWESEERRKVDRRNLQHNKNLKEKLEQFDLKPPPHHFW